MLLGFSENLFESGVDLLLCADPKIVAEHFRLVDWNVCAVPVPCFCVLRSRLFSVFTFLNDQTVDLDSYLLMKVVI